MFFSPVCWGIAQVLSGPPCLGCGCHAGAAPVQPHKVAARDDIFRWTHHRKKTVGTFQEKQLDNKKHKGCWISEQTVTLFAHLGRVFVLGGRGFEMMRDEILDSVEVNADGNCWWRISTFDDSSRKIANTRGEMVSEHLSLTFWEPQKLKQKNTREFCFMRNMLKPVGPPGLRHGTRLLESGGPKMLWGWYF